MADWMTRLRMLRDYIERRPWLFAALVFCVFIVIALISGNGFMALVAVFLAVVGYVQMWAYRRRKTRQGSP